MKILKIMIFLCAFCAVGCLQSKKKTEEKKTLANIEMNTLENNEADVKNAVDALNKMIVKPERSMLNEITSNELTYGHSSGKIQDKAAFIDDLINGSFDFLSITLSKQSIHIDGNTAIARHIFFAKATNDRKPVDVKIGNVLVFIKQGGSWKLLARQAYKL